MRIYTYAEDYLGEEVYRSTFNERSNTVAFFLQKEADISLPKEEIEEITFFLTKYSIIRTTIDGLGNFNIERWERKKIFRSERDYKIVEMENKDLQTILSCVKLYNESMVDPFLIIEGPENTNNNLAFKSFIAALLGSY